jgi:hypothetical protein
MVQRRAVISSLSVDRSHKFLKYWINLFSSNTAGRRRHMFSS